MRFSNPEFYVGLRFEIEGDCFVVDEILPDLNIIRLRGKLGEICEFELEDFRFQLFTGRIINKNLYLSEEVVNSQLTLGIGMLSEKDRIETEIKYSVVIFILKMQEKSRTWEEILALLRLGKFTYQGQPTPIQKNKRCFQYWLSKFRAEGLFGLVPKYFRCGHSSRLTLEYIEAAKETIERRYLSGESLSIARLEKLTRVHYLKKCAEGGIQPTSPTGKKAVLSVLSQYALQDQYRRRLDPRTAKKLLKVSTQAHEVERLLERVECDSTPLDIFNLFIAENDDLSQMRPVLISVIDCCTSFVLACTLSFEEATGDSVAKTLIQGATPYTEEFFEKNDIQNQTQVYGQYSIVALDQGAENHAAEVVRLTEVLGFTIEMGMPGAPEVRGYIESLMAAVNDFVQQFKGATQSKIRKKRLRTDQAMNEATLTIDELNKFIQNWTFDIHNTRPLERLSFKYGKPTSPLDAVIDHQKDLKYNIPPSAEMIRRTMLTRYSKTPKLTNKGISFEGLKYTSTNLAKLYLESAPDTRVHVFYDPLDIREIAVSKEIGGELIWVPSKYKIPALGFRDIKEFKRKVRGDNSDVTESDINHYELLAKYDELMEDKENKGRKKGSKPTHGKLTATNRILKKEARIQEILKRSSTPLPSQKGGLDNSSASKPNRRLPPPAKIIDVEDE